MTNHTDAQQQHEFVPPPFDVTDGLCRAIVESSADYTLRGGTALRHCLEIQDSPVHRVNKEAGPEFAPTVLKLWICTTCLAPRLYSSWRECQHCGSKITETASYVREDLAIPKSVMNEKLAEAMNESADIENHLASVIAERNETITRLKRRITMSSSETPIEFVREFVKNGCHHSCGEDCSYAGQQRMKRARLIYERHCLAGAQGDAGSVGVEEALRQLRERYPDGRFQVLARSGKPAYSIYVLPKPWISLHKVFDGPTLTEALAAAMAGEDDKEKR